MTEFTLESVKEAIEILRNRDSFRWEPPKILMPESMVEPFPEMVS